MEVMKHKNYLEMQKMATPEVINFQTPFVVYALPRGYKLVAGLLLGGILGLLAALAVKYRGVIVAYLKEK
jgi:Na+/H+-translocating membrane pyrophosphatase